MHVLSWPKTRRLTDSRGDRWQAVIEPGRLQITVEGVVGAVVLDCRDTDELRAFAMQVYAAAIDHDGAVQEEAVKASIERRRLRGLGGLRHRPVVERPEPPMHMEVPA